MDVSKYLLLALLLATASSSPMVQDGEVKEGDDDVTTPTSEASTEAATLSAPKNCTTARDLPGACITREYCDYGTPAIDLTLYAPKAYVKSCKADEVCCPLTAISLPSESNSSLTPSRTDDNAFDFDEDD